MKCWIILSLQFVAINAVGQLDLKNTRWKGAVKELKDANFEVQFKSDTAVFVYSYPSPQRGVFTFKQNHDTLIISKVSGPGGCPDQSKGIYTIEIIGKGEKFLLHLVKDECTGRIRGLTANQYERIIDK